MKYTYRLNTFLAVVMGLVCLVYLLVRTWSPAAILPPLDLMLACAVSLTALVLEHYTGKGAERRSWPFLVLFSAAVFACLPLASGLLPAGDLLRFALTGCAAFTVLTFLFTAICQRLASGPAGKLAPLLSAGVLFLAVQGCSHLFP